MSARESASDGGKSGPKVGAKDGPNLDGKPGPARRLVAIVLDEASIGRSNADQEQECSIAIYDLLDRNSFAVPGHDRGPYRLTIALHEKKLLFRVSDDRGEPVIAHLLSLTPFRRVVRDYFMLCDSYYGAIRTRSAAEIEAIDMGRRGLHDEAAALLVKRLHGKIEIDFDTARRLFTLIAALHWKG
ncbi:MAG: UPF0262 family protein [Hyphomicrobiales bacterium]|nr:UPF0262 family protein [Hyphomicrobiales bacterium]MBV8769135.1 UPF0262 family protein [Hyphomicrobiales bacterium]MBV9051900.1 UPF0262 family protein [Hyphomicrobiales bacterium]MBV9589981.1 UPF0262 family protein [Hyphomicrobiales bacterium]MBV9976053.1 UPF0262 family protein [Hyphomicrobiales bacterium]